MTKPKQASSQTGHLFASRKPKERTDVTHERISEDLEAFRKAGGKIEVLGVTRSLLRIGPDADASAPPAATAPITRSRR